VPMPPADHLGAVTRGLTTVERDGVSLRKLIAERTFDATLDEVWDALTSPERVPRWIGGGLSGDLRLGGRFQIEGNAGGEVLGCEPPRTLSVTWEYAGQVSWVDVTLADDGHGTRLLLEHTAPVDPQMWEQFGPGAVGIGWEMALMGLTEHLDSPDADPDEVKAWLEGPEGRAYLVEFMTAAGERWVDESIAFGTDTAAARAAGERCTAAYTAPPPAG
jgi:uncharacterized protein YndB with AHSA1/START domain